MLLNPESRSLCVQRQSELDLPADKADNDIRYGPTEFFSESLVSCLIFIKLKITEENRKEGSNNGIRSKGERD